jgi:large conductance mechanosensitive channel
MFQGFRDFVIRGNAIDLAVGVIIGAAFSAVVASLSADIITPLIGLLFGTPDFSSIVAGPFNVGNVINAIVQLLITAFVLYFFIVAPMNRLKPPPANPAMKNCPECLTSIPAAATRCSACTAVQP